MKKIFYVVSTAMALLFTQTVLAADLNSPVGLWKTIDDVTGKPKAIVEIKETSAHALEGTVLKIFPRPGYDQNEVCSECRGPNHNKKIVGMMILEDLRADKDNPGRWNGGKILDPKNGKTYKCTIQLASKNQQLNVRGYIGLPLFGRSQIWNRVDKVE